MCIYSGAKLSWLVVGGGVCARMRPCVCVRVLKVCETNFLGIKFIYGLQWTLVGSTDTKCRYIFIKLCSPFAELCALSCMCLYIADGTCVSVLVNIYHPDSL